MQILIALYSGDNSPPKTLKEVITPPSNVGSDCKVIILFRTTPSSPSKYVYVLLPLWYACPSVACSCSRRRWLRLTPPLPPGARRHPSGVRCHRRRRLVADECIGRRRRRLHPERINIAALSHTYYRYVHPFRMYVCGGGGGGGFVGSKKSSPTPARLQNNPGALPLFGFAGFLCF